MKTPVPQSLFNKIAGLRPAIWKTFKNTFFYRTPPVAASLLLIKTSRKSCKIYFNYLVFIVSATGRSRDIRIPLCLSALVRKKFNIVSKNHGRTQKCDFCVSVDKTNLQSITHLIQYTVLDIQFWSIKCTTATVRYGKISNISIPSHQVLAMQTASDCNG